MTRAGAWSIVVAISLSVTASACSSSGTSSQSTTSTTASDTPATKPPRAWLRVRGTATVDGSPFSADFLGAVVRRDKLITPCQRDIPPVLEGSYSIDVLPDADGANCGLAGADIVLWTFVNGHKLYADHALAWPTQDLTTTFDAQFSTTAPNGAVTALTELSGEADDAKGNPVPAGTLVEAYIGNARCGVASTRVAGTDFNGYVLTVVGPDAIPQCTRDAKIRFVVGGKPAKETYTNDLSGGATGSGAKFPLTQT